MEKVLKYVLIFRKPVSGLHGEAGALPSTKLDIPFLHQSLFHYVYSTGKRRKAAEIGRLLDVVMTESAERRHGPLGTSAYSNVTHCHLTFF